MALLNHINGNEVALLSEEATFSLKSLQGSRKVMTSKNNSYKFRHKFGRVTCPQLIRREMKIQPRLTALTKISAQASQLAISKFAKTKDMLDTNTDTGFILQPPYVRTS